MQVVSSRVLLRPTDFDRSVRFYEQVLGLVRYREWGEAPHRGVMYFLGGGFLELTEGGGWPPPQGVKLWLQVPDLEAAARELEAAGVELLRPPRLEPWGLLEAAVCDPDGLELILVEVPVTHPLRRRRPGT